MWLSGPPGDAGRSTADKAEERPITTDPYIVTKIASGRRRQVLSEAHRYRLFRSARSGPDGNEIGPPATGPVPSPWIGACAVGGRWQCCASAYCLLHWTPRCSMWHYRPSPESCTLQLRLSNGSSIPTPWRLVACSWFLAVSPTTWGGDDFCC